MACSFKISLISFEQCLCSLEDVYERPWHLNTSSHFRIEQRPKQEARTAETDQEQFKAVVAEAARPFIMARTDRFVDEIELFLASGVNIEAYDAIYKQRLGSREMGAANVARGEDNERTRVTPYLFLFEEDSD